MSLDPKTRIEYFLDGIVNDHDVYKPQSRAEQFLADIKVGNVCSLIPKNRTEMFLSKISGANIVLPTPKTRIECYLAAIAGEDVNVPSPQTRIEQFLLEWLSKSKRLPDGYKRLLGFSMNNDCYFVITDFRLKGSDTLRFSFSASQACNILGCYTSGSAQTNYSLYVGTSGSKYMRYNGGTYNSTIVPNQRYNMIISATGARGISDETWAEKDFTASSDFCVGTTSTGASSAKLIGSLYGNIIVDGRLNLVPLERISDNVLGYYDLVNDTFYEPTIGSPTSIGYA